MGKRYPVPTYARCQPTIDREAAYWGRRRFGLTRDDLKQEGWIVAKRVLRNFLPIRGNQIETVLTLALRREFRRMVGRSMARALLREPREGDKVPIVHTSVSTAGQLDARLMLRRLRRLRQPYQRLARDLVEHNGKVKSLARAKGWTLRDARQRVATLRELLDPENGKGRINGTGRRRHPA